MSWPIDRLDAFADAVERRRWKAPAAVVMSNLQHALICVAGPGTAAVVAGFVFQLWASAQTGHWFVSLWPFTTPLFYGVAAGWAFYLFREIAWRVVLWWRNRHYFSRAVRLQLAPRDGVMDVLLPIAYNAPAVVVAFGGNAQIGLLHWTLSVLVILGYTIGNKP